MRCSRPRVQASAAAAAGTAPTSRLVNNDTSIPNSIPIYYSPPVSCLKYFFCIAKLAHTFKLEAVTWHSVEHIPPPYAQQIRINCRDVNKAGSFKAKARSLKAKAKARDQG